MAFVDLTCKHSFPFQLGRAGAPLSRETKELHLALATATAQLLLASLLSPCRATGWEVVQSPGVEGVNLSGFSPILLLFPSASHFSASECVSHGAKSLDSAVYCFRSLLHLVCTEQCKSEETVCERMGGGDPWGTRSSLGHSRGAGLWPFGSGKSLHFQETFWGPRGLAGLEHDLPGVSSRLHSPEPCGKERQLLQLSRQQAWREVCIIYCLGWAQPGWTKPLQLGRAYSCCCPL